MGFTWLVVDSWTLCDLINGPGVVKTTLLLPPGDGGMLGSRGAGMTCLPISTSIGLGLGCWWSGENINLGMLDVGEWRLWTKGTNDP